jgi:hypothetical protein
VACRQQKFIYHSSEIEIFIYHSSEIELIWSWWGSAPLFISVPSGCVVLTWSRIRAALWCLFNQVANPTHEGSAFIVESLLKAPPPYSTLVIGFLMYDFCQDTTSHPIAHTYNYVEQGRSHVRHNWLSAWPSQSHLISSNVCVWGFAICSESVFQG